MKNRALFILITSISILCFLLCIITYWLNLTKENNKRFDCYSLVTFSKPLATGNITLIVHFLLNKNNNGIMTLTGENDKNDAKVFISREIHFSYEWKDEGQLKLYNIKTIKFQSDDIKDSAFKESILNFDLPEIYMIVHRLNNSYILGSLSSPITVCVDKDES